MNVLDEGVAPNAILNAGGREDGVGCHPGTRKAIIGQFENWRDAKDGQTAPILWLRGSARAGRTEIVQAIAEHCIMQEILQANFFFSREDPSRNTSSSLVAMLLHQVIQLYPAIQKTMGSICLQNPMIFSRSEQYQLVELMAKTLRVIQQSSLFMHIRTASRRDSSVLLLRPTFSYYVVPLQKTDILHLRV